MPACAGVAAASNRAAPKKVGECIRDIIPRPPPDRQVPAGTRGPVPSTAAAEATAAADSEVRHYRPGTGAKRPAPPLLPCPSPTAGRRTMACTGLSTSRVRLNILYV